MNYLKIIFYSFLGDLELADCFEMLTEPNIDLVYFIKEHNFFLNLPEIDVDENPLNIDTIKELQDKGSNLSK